MTTPKETFEALRQKRLTISCGESFTGGGIASKLIENVGASEILSFSAVCYSNEAKQKILYVPSETIEQYGAVSAQTVEKMLDGLNKIGLSDVQVATAGNAGPTAEKEGEVGVVYIGTMFNGKKEVKKYLLSGDRTSVIKSGVELALSMVYDAIQEKH